MDRPDLELVRAITDAGSVTAAAARLRIAQPALSRRLARLERELGAPLFVRGRHGAVPTPAGRILAERAAVALDEIHRAERDTADAAAGRAGALRIGTTPTLGADLLPEVLAALRRATPAIRLDLTTSGDSAKLRDDVAAGTLDVAVAVLDETTGARVALSAPQRFVLVLPADHRLAAREVVPHRALRGEPLVALRHGEGLRLVVDALFAELGTEPDISIETTEREMLLPFVAAGLGVTIVPEVFARQRAGAGVAVRPLRPALVRRVGAVVRAGPMPALVDRFVAALRSHVAAG